MKKLMILVIALVAMVATSRTASAQAAPPPTPVPAQAAGLAGTWHFVLDTPGGDRESEATFMVDGETVTGKYGKDNAAGTFKDGKMALAFPIETEEAGNGTLSLKGTLDGDTITGDWAFTDYSGTFKATRKPATAAAGAGTH